MIDFLNSNILILLVLQIDFLNLHSLNTFDYVLLWNVVLLHDRFVILNAVLVSRSLLFLFCFGFGHQLNTLSSLPGLVLDWKRLPLIKGGLFAIGWYMLCGCFIHLHTTVIVLSAWNCGLLAHVTVVDFAVDRGLRVVPLMRCTLMVSLERKVIILGVSCGLVGSVVIVIVLNVDDSRAVVDMHVGIIVLLFCSLASLSRVVDVFNVIVRVGRELRLAHEVFELIILRHVLNALLLLSGHVLGDCLLLVLVHAGSPRVA